MKTYVYHDTEVKMTGRIATKTGSRGQQETLYEITPLDDGPTWKKWVKLGDLYEIQQSKTIVFDAKAIRQAQENNKDDIP